jgi:hypothetical protein
MLFLPVSLGQVQAYIQMLELRESASAQHLSNYRGLS